MVLELYTNIYVAYSVSNNYCKYQENLDSSHIRWKYNE